VHRRRWLCQTYTQIEDGMGLKVIGFIIGFLLGLAILCLLIAVGLALVP